MKLLFISLLISFLHWAHLSAEEILVTCQINKHITHYGGLKGVNEPELVLEGNSIDSLYQKKEFIKIDFDKKKLIDSSFNFQTKFSEIHFFEEPFAKISGDFAIIHDENIDPKISGDFRDKIRLFRLTGELIYVTDVNPLSDFYSDNGIKYIGFKITRIYDCIKDTKKF